MKPLQEDINWNHIHLPHYPEIHPNPAIQKELMQEQFWLQRLANLDNVSLDDMTRAELKTDHTIKLNEARKNLRQLNYQAA